MFARPDGQPQISRKSTCLFPAFAQYLTDGFLRTVPGHADRTTSNHEIDLCTLYGRTPAQTRALRLKSSAPGRLGRLKSQMIGLEEFSPFLYAAGTKDLSDPEFADLDPPLVDENLPPERRDALFAVGGDRVNSTPFTAMMNTLVPARAQPHRARARNPQSGMGRRACLPGGAQHRHPDLHQDRC